MEPVLMEMLAASRQREIEEAIVGRHHWRMRRKSREGIRRTHLSRGTWDPLTR